MTAFTALGSAAAGSGNVSMTVGANVPIGATLVVIVYSTGLGMSISAPTDSQGNTYVAVNAGQGTSTVGSRAFVCVGVTNALTNGVDTITTNRVGTGGCAILAEMIDATGALDVTPAGSSSTTNSPTTSTGVLAQAREIIYGFTLDLAAARTLSEASGFTTIESVTATVGFHTAYQLVSSTASVTYAPTLTGTAGLTHIEVFSFKALTVFTQACQAATNGLAKAAKGGSRSAPTSSSPLSSMVRSVAAIRRGSSSPLGSSVRAVSATTRASSSPLATLARAAGAIRRASSSPIASSAHAPGKAIQASTTPAKSQRNAMSVVRAASTTPAKSLKNAVAHAVSRVTFPLSSLQLSTAAIRGAVTAPLASDTKALVTTYQGSSSPVASSAELKTALQSALTSTSPIALLTRGAGKVAQALAVTLATNIRIRPVGLQAVSSPLATSAHPVGKFIQAITRPIAFAIPGKPQVNQASTSPVSSIRRAMARITRLRTPFVGSPVFLGRASASTGSGLTIQTLADAPAGTLIAVVAAQYGGQFASVSDGAGSGYLGVDAGATTTPIYVTLFYAVTTSDLLAGAFINLFSAVTDQLRAASAVAIPLADPTFTIDVHGNFNAANGASPIAATGPLSFSGEVAIAYAVNPNGATGYDEGAGFSTIDNNAAVMGLHLATQTTGDLGGLSYAPAFGGAQDYGVNVVTFQTGWAPTAAVTRSLVTALPALALAVASLANQGVKLLQATSSPLASMVGNLVASGVESASAAVLASLQSAMSIARQIGVTVIASRTASAGKTSPASTQGVASLGVLKVVISLLQAVTSPVASNAHAAQKAILKAVTVLASRVSAMTKSITITTTQIASGTRSFVSTFGASSGPVASLVANIVNGLKLAASTSPIASLMRGAAKVMRAQTSPVAGGSRSSGGIHPTITTPIASLSRGTTKVLGGAANALASTSHAASHHIQAVVVSVVATVKRTVPALPFRASTAPVASALVSPLRVRVIQASALTVASLATVWRFFGRRMAVFMRGRKV